MAMKFLQTVQEDMRVMGFAPNQQQNSCWGFSSRQIISAFVYGLNCVLIGSNMFWGDNATSEENMDTIFTLIVFVPILAVFISIVLKNDQIFNTIDFLTLELNTSKFYFLIFFNLDFNFKIIHAVRSFFLRIKEKFRVTGHL